MQRFFIAVLVLLLCAPSEAQWHKVRDFPYIDNEGISEKADIRCIYFMDKVGLPNVGYVGTGQNGLWKTTDGGTTWQGYLAGTANEIYFKDSLTGWIDWYSNPARFSRTTDGGRSWVTWQTGFSSLSYCYPSSRLFATMGDTLKYSTDLGETWNSSLVLLYPSVESFDSNFGLGAYFWQDWLTSDSTHGGFLVSSNSGSTWDTVPFPDTAFLTGFGRTFVDQRTGVCFENAGNGSIFRSDDHGYHWRRIYDFGIIAGSIKGSLERLVATSDSQFYVSTNEGLSWRNIGGPPTSPDVFGPIISHYYVLGDKIFAVIRRDKGTAYSELWEGAIPPGASVNSSPSSDTSILISPNPTHDRITLDLEAPATYEVRDMLGAVRLRGRAEAAKATLDVSSLPAGVYYISSGSTRARFVKE